MNPKYQSNHSTKYSNTWKFTGSNSYPISQNKSQFVKKYANNYQPNKPKSKSKSKLINQKKNSSNFLQNPQKTTIKQNLLTSGLQINQQKKLKHNSQPTKSTSKSTMFNFLNDEQKKQKQLQKRQTQLQKRQAQQQRWNRNSQIGTQSRIMEQYDKYFSDSENVFFQDSKMIKQLDTIKSCWKGVLCLFILSVLLWVFIWSIKPYSNLCPRHATCGAYINCHQGYVLDNKLQVCQVDPQVTEFALALMNSIVEDIKLQYGQQQCNPIPQNITTQQLLQLKQVPKISMHKIYRNLDIMSDDFSVLRTQLSKIFKDKNNQAMASFGVDQMSRVYPLEKSYTITCRMDLFYRHNFNSFIILVIAIIIVIILVSIKLSNKLYRQRGNRIYQYLKMKVIENKQICFHDYKLQIEQKFNNSKPISEQLWVLINQYRIKEKVIGSYEVNRGVVWKLIGMLMLM